MNAPELPGAETAYLPFVSIEARRATLSLLGSVGAFESGPSGEWNFVNPHLCTMLDVPASSLLGREWIKMIHPDDVQRAVAEYKQARDGGRSWHHELRFRRFDGTLLPVLIDASPLPQDPEARGVSYLGVVSDVSREVRALEIVEESRAALQAMLDVIVEGVLIHRMGRIVAANNGAARIFGFDDWRDLVGKNGTDFVAPEDRERFLAAAASGSSAETIGIFIRADGSRVRVSVHARPIVYAGAPARATVLQSLDSPTMLQLTNTRLQAQVDALEKRLMLPHSRVESRNGVPTLTAANQAYADLVGRPLAEIPGLPMSEVAPPELNVEQWTGYQARVASGQRKSIFDITYRRPDGSTTVGRVYAVDYPDPVTGEMTSLSFVVPL